MNQLKFFWDQSFTDWKYRLPLHLGFWLFFLYSWLDESMVVKIGPKQYYLITLTGVLFIWHLYYSLVYGIWPFFAKRKWLIGIVLFVFYYIIAVALRAYHIELIIKWYNFKQTSIAGSEFFKNLYRSQFQVTALSRIIFSGLTSLIVVIYVPLTIKFLRYTYQFSQKQAWIMKENAQLQLNTLKAQLNPHFFFNTLNNLQSFIVQKENEKSADLLTKLADFMRTALYDGNKEWITMDKEIELLQNYVAIEKVRFEAEAQINLHITNDFPSYHIPPFIFLPFVENAFKHGGNLPTDQVKIAISLVNYKDKIILKTSNTFQLTSSNTTAHGGIGIENVRKRLAHYFPNRYRLDLSTNGVTFNVDLELFK